MDMPFHASMKVISVLNPGITIIMHNYALIKSENKKIRAPHVQSSYE